MNNGYMLKYTLARRAIILMGVVWLLNKIWMNFCIVFVFLILFWLLHVCNLAFWWCIVHVIVFASGSGHQMTNQPSHRDCWLQQDEFIFVVGCRSDQMNSCAVHHRWYSPCRSKCTSSPWESQSKTSSAAGVLMMWWATDFTDRMTSLTSCAPTLQTASTQPPRNPREPVHTPPSTTTPWKTATTCWPLGSITTSTRPGETAWWLTLAYYGRAWRRSPSEAAVTLTPMRMICRTPKRTMSGRVVKWLMYDLGCSLNRLCVWVAVFKPVPTGNPRGEGGRGFCMDVNFFVGPVRVVKGTTSLMW